MIVHRLPPGQSATRKFPVVGERRSAPDPIDLGRFRLEVGGAVESPFELGWSDYLALPHSERVADLHCVTGWSRFETRLTGIPLAALLARARPFAEARFVRFEAFSARAHDTSLPLALALEDSWLVHAVDGRPLEPEHGGPLRTVTPARYFYKSLKWLRRIELLVEDRLGYWERESAYHNTGDWRSGDQRFTTGSIDPEELARFRVATDLAPWRLPRKVLLAADLRDWQPKTRNLQRLQIKNSRLERANLEGCDLTAANLSLSNLRHANLRNATLRDADLEGADFTGADLTNADLTGTALSATRFHSVDRAGNFEAARVDGLVLDNVSGLLEDQEAWLRTQGIRIALLDARDEKTSS